VRTWATVTLEDVTTEGSEGLRRGPFGGAIKKDSFVPDGYKIYEQRHAIYGDFEAGSYFIRDRHYRELKSFAVMPGDLIVSCSGTLGRVAMVPPGVKPGIINQALLRIRPRQDVVSSRFFKMLLETPEIQSRMFGSGGSAIKNVKPLSEIRKVEFQLPPMSEQRQIADVLDRAEVLRAKRRAALAQLDTLTQSIFLDLFGDPATNPKGWPRFTLGDLIVAGPQNGLYKPSADYGSGTPILRIDAFYDGAVTKLRTLKRVRLPDKERELYELRAEDIVVNRVNSMEYLGKSALIPKLGEPIVFESNMMRFEVDGQRVEPRYVVQFLQSAFVKGQILTAAKHAVNQSSINQNDVQNFRINVPPIAVQREFRRRATAVEELMGTHEASLAKLDMLFAVLQHRAFRGEL